MPPRKRRTVVDDLRALREGGMGALLVAERLAGGADDLIRIRVSKARKALYTDAAKRNGVTLSAWLIALADAAVT